MGNFDFFRIIRPGTCTCGLGSCLICQSKVQPLSIFLQLFFKPSHLKSSNQMEMWNETMTRIFSYLKPAYTITLEVAASFFFICSLKTLAMLMFAPAFFPQNRRFSIRHAPVFVLGRISGCILGSIGPKHDDIDRSIAHAAKANKTFFCPQM